MYSRYRFKSLRMYIGYRFKSLRMYIGYRFKSLRVYIGYRLNHTLSYTVSLLIFSMYSTMYCILDIGTISHS